jgi:mono/diheme cytochrome c family protein
MSALRPLVLAAGLALSACATTPDTQANIARQARLEAAQLRGHDFAAQRCAMCHAVGIGAGGAQSGPAFHNLSVRYDPISLERRFIEVSQHGFNGMPPTPMSRGEAEDLVAYLDTLRRQ